MIEILLLRRNEKIAFHGGAWVFPGGRVDDSDDASSELEIAKRAGARETLEETGLTIGVDALLPFAHWTTPVDLPKRFATWFFYAPYRGAEPVQVDNSEIVDFRWLSPAAALAQHTTGELVLPAPTFVTLLGLREVASLHALTAQTYAIQRFEPRLVPFEGGRCTLYQEDAGYASGDFHAVGPRHRLLMQGTDWRYVREF